jgi:hypothetical protein
VSTGLLTPGPGSSPGRGAKKFKGLRREARPLRLSIPSTGFIGIRGFCFLYRWKSQRIALERLAAPCRPKPGSDSLGLTSAVDDQLAA